MSKIWGISSRRISLLCSQGRVPGAEKKVEATNFVKTMESHQHRKIGCLEEIAYLNGWITKEDVLKVYEILKKNQYGQYLKDVLDGKYLDVLH